jgi:hypothetical protein
MKDAIVSLKAEVEKVIKFAKEVQRERASVAELFHPISDSCEESQNVRLIAAA